MSINRPRIYSQNKESLLHLLPLSTPISAHIDISSLCNFRCSFCFQADTKGMKDVGLDRGFMDLGLFNKIIEDLKEFPDKIKKIKIGNHGEPTLHSDIDQCIKIAKESETCEIVEVFTNGSKLESNLNKKIVQAGLQRINISLEGLSDEAYKKVAGVKINFKDIINGVKNLYETKVELGSDLIIYVKIADNAHDLDKNSNNVNTLNEEDRNYFF